MTRSASSPSKAESPATRLLIKLTTEVIIFSVSYFSF
jgi:hypothetical protein